MEYASGGNLHDLMIEQSQKRFAEPQAAKFVFELCSALAYCHALKVIHRDIKPENLVLDEEGSLKVTDFGSCVHSRDSNGFWKLQSTVCGTLDYLAPELVEEKLYKETVDCWCVGILCFELLTGKPPFAKPSPADTKRAIVHNDITFPSFVSPTAKDLIRRVCILAFFSVVAFAPAVLIRSIFCFQLLFKDPAGRLAMEQALEHPWIKEHIGLEKRKEALERIPLIFSPQPS
ncbi:unnamed protein product [Cyprideis torosa]|uniref:Protein kinase domain-containing protein n=1 Tax=Cyprideis torosa TaxID=163714 RepID=A0A7R8ZP15_9CRUS|nr:unnamed protein product [Cyprideis torosa]CAG0897702.1 unnamed protein product [Cyprideis torosa]